MRDKKYKLFEKKPMLSMRKAEQIIKSWIEPEVISQKKFKIH